MQNEICYLIQRINDDPDKLHSDYTPSVIRLIEIGKPVLKEILVLMLSHDNNTRLRAQRVIEGVTMKMYGFRPGHGWESVQRENEWSLLWDSLGNLSWDAPLEQRSKSVSKWLEWITQHTKDMSSKCSKV